MKALFLQVSKGQNNNLYLICIYFYFATQNVQRKKEKIYTTERRGEEALNRNHRAYIVRLPQLQLMLATNLRSKRFQSRYSAKVGAGAKKKWKGEGQGRRGNACP